MADSILRYTDFSGRLVLAGGRDQIPQNALRRCVGAAPEPEPLLKSRWGSSLRFPVPNVISLGCFAEQHYLYDGASLWEADINAGSTAQVVSSGYNGNRVTMLKAPPAFGVEDYLFMLGGGKLQKISPEGVVSNWGIDAPGIGMTATVLAQDQTVIAAWNSSVEGWTGDTTLALQTADPKLIYSGGGSLQVTPQTYNWWIGKDFTQLPYSPLNLAVYQNGDLSLPTDYLYFWVYMTNPDYVQWLWLTFALDRGNAFLAQNYYRAVVAVTGTTNTTGLTAGVPTGGGGSAAAIINVKPQQWTQIAVAKSQFQRVGANLNLDWSSVYGVQIQGGNALNALAPSIYFDAFTMFGGVPIGIGPAAVTGGSTLKYLATFGNNTTGNDSNPMPVPAAVSHVAEQAVQLSNIPVASDPQVNNRKLWRTSEGGELFFYLDIIGDNTTTIYKDVIASLAGQPIVATPWVANAWYAPQQYIDGGNGYYFQRTNTDPGVVWAATTAYALGQITLPIGSPLGARFQVTTAGTSGSVRPPWASVSGVGTPVGDGTAMWQNIGIGTMTGGSPPIWKVPDTVWSPLAAFNAIGEAILPFKAAGHNAFRVTQTGTSGALEPRWAGVPVGNTIIDGTVVWQNVGPLSTTDGGITWVCVAQNASPALGSDQVQYDNSLFPAGCTDAAYFAGAMFVTGDPANPNWIYVSTPGKSEGYVNIIRVGSEDDPIQRVVIWDTSLWTFTTRYIYPLLGTPPNLTAGERALGAEGTSWPFTVQPAPLGIIYRAVSGLRVFNNATNDLIGFAAISPIERGRTVENVAPFGPVIAAPVREEMLFSDGVVSFGFSLVAQTWRMIGLGFNALFYHDELEVVHAAVAAAVLNFEDETSQTDNGAPIPIEWQTASSLADGTQLTMLKRIWFDLDLGGQILTPTLLVDNAEITLPALTNPPGRATICVPYEIGGRLFGLRLTGKVTAPVVWYGLWSETRQGR